MNKKIQAIKVKQWLSTWNSVAFDAEKRRQKPEPFFYMFSISAKALKKLSGVFRRSAENRKSASEEFGIQRKHDPNRSETIKEYVKNGYPWSELTETKRKSGEFEDLKQPGWLPTAIVINILKDDDTRRKRKVKETDLVRIENNKDELSKIILPANFDGENWLFEELPPIEIIDGQHRLWAFENPDFEDDYELPVVAFHGLDISWQAYLFYTINISPKKINRSLAYDLYPLLRTEEWLEKFEGHVIYRETRAQELVDILYSHPESPWENWINMLGETGGNKMVSQSAWIRSLLATFVKSYEGRGVRIGGIFGAKVGEHETVLPWGKEEQAALLIFVGNLLKNKIEESDYEWIKKIKAGKQKDLIEQKNTAFYGDNTLLNQDQGIRALLYITNDFLFELYDDLNLEGIFSNQQSGSDFKIISSNVLELENTNELSSWLNELMESLAKFDWRSYGAEDLSDKEERIKRGYRGSGGYKVLRIDILNFLKKNASKRIVEVCKNILIDLGEDE